MLVRLYQRQRRQQNKRRSRQHPRRRIPQRHCHRQRQARPRRHQPRRQPPPQISARREYRQPESDCVDKPGDIARIKRPQSRRDRQQRRIQRRVLRVIRPPEPFPPRARQQPLRREHIINRATIQRRAIRGIPRQRQRRPKRPQRRQRQPEPAARHPPPQSDAPRQRPCHIHNAPNSTPQNSPLTTQIAPALITRAGAIAFGFPTPTIG